MFLLLCSSLIMSQQRIVSGFVKDVDSGEPLAGAYVFDSISTRGSSANEYGFFSQTIDIRSTHIRISYVGYDPQIFCLDSVEQELETYYLRTNNSFDEVFVFGTQSLQRVSGSSQIKLPLSLVKSQPSLLGEPDLFKTIMLLPGVQTGVEGTAGLHVRGGSSDQNLILLNEMTLYNVNHLLGFLSVFNMDAMRSATFLKGGLPARYGGRLSSVLDVKMKEGNLKEFHGIASIGLLSSQLMMEGPILKEKIGYMIAARRTYSDLLYRPILISKSDVNGGYSFYDINGNLYWNLNERNSLYYSLFNGNDKGFLNEDYSAETSQKIKIRWGNTAQAIRWNHVYNTRAFSNLSLTYSSYRYLNNRAFLQTENLFNKEIITENSYSASIKDIAVKYGMEQNIGTHHQLQYGIAATYHVYKPGITSVYSMREGIDSSIIARKVEAVEIRGYVEDHILLFDKLEINVGMHLSSFFVDDTSYASIEPRISGVFHIGEKGSVKASYSRLSQYVGLLSSTCIGLPTDLWIPATRQIPPQSSELFVLGYHHFTKWMNLSVEAYYKSMDGLVEYKQGASYNLGRESWEELVAVGTGEAYGIEFLGEKNFGKVSGWISYTLSKNTRHFPEIDDSFPYKYDRRHNLSFTGIYNFSKRTGLSFIWVYYSGENVTLSNARYVTYPGLTSDYQFNAEWFPGLSTVENFTDRNNLQLEPYHRLDIGMTIKKMKKKSERIWRFGIYNIYNRQNTFFIMMYEDEEDVISLNKYSFTPIMPYVRYEIKF